MMIILIYLTRKFTPLEPRDNFNFICGKETTMNGCKAFYKLGARLEAGVHQRAAFLRHAADERSMHMFAATAANMWGEKPNVNTWGCVHFKGVHVGSHRTYACVDKKKT